jgi:16S rRNA (cytosine967-C5)-methyltransferase
MAPGRPKSARTLAIDVLNRFSPKRNYAASILNNLLDQTAEKQRATDLVFGTIRNRSAIDTVIAAFSSRPTERIPPRLLNILRIAAYELIYRPETPDYSIVNEAVENAKEMLGKKPVGFVNAVLRNITRHTANRQAQLYGADVRTTLPQTPATGCQFDTPIVPDPQTYPADCLSAAFSLPKWLIADWLGEFGFERTRQICFASNRRPSIYIRTNPLRTTAGDLAQKLHEQHIDFETVPPDILRESSIEYRESRIEYRASRIEYRASSMIRIKSAAAVTQLPGFAEGLFTVQDLAASLAVKILDPQPGWKILDLCAAPGVKTTQLAEITASSAEITATDADSERLKKVKQNITRLGITGVTVVEDAQLLEVSKFKILNSKFSGSGPFDAVLLDAPCSNTGVLAKRIEARYRLNPAAIQEFTATQDQLLCTAASMTGPRGRICYSTCSIQKAENNELVADFLRRNPDFELDSETLILPSAEIPEKDCAYQDRQIRFDHDGAYVAILIRR